MKVGHEECVEGGNELRGDAGLRGGGGAKEFLDNVGNLLFDNVLAGGVQRGGGGEENGIKWEGAGRSGAVSREEGMGRL